MPMIDVYAFAGIFSNKHKLAQDLAKAVMEWETVPPINLFKNNTAAFVHELPVDAISNAAGDGKSYVRVKILTPAGARDRDKGLGVVGEVTDIVAAAANDPELASRTGCSSPNHQREDGELVAARTRVRTSSPLRGLSCRRAINSETEGIGGRLRPLGDL